MTVAPPQITPSEALAELGTWAAGSPLAEAGEGARSALERAVANLLAVTAGAASLPEQAELRAVWTPDGGPATLIGTGRGVSVEAAVWLNSVSSVATERDEGNRYSKGHPAAQTVFAVLALAESRKLSGPRVWEALYVAYEIAARVGRATSFSPLVHTHGPLGAAGAAAGCAVLLGADAAVIARAIDTGAAMAPATSWTAVHSGSAVRDQWVGAGALAGLAAARYAVAGMPGGAGGIGRTFGGVFGAIDLDLLVDGLGQGSLVSSSYLKQHSACAYTHGPADAALGVRAQLHAAGIGVDSIRSVRVDGVASAAALPAREWTSRHGAYFSVPFAVSSALLYGDVGAERARVPAPAEHAALARLVDVHDDTVALAPRTPTSRPARVSVIVEDARVFSSAVSHPQGDAVDTPFSPERIDALLSEALSPLGLDAAAVRATLAAMHDPAPGALTTALSHLTPLREGALR
ncbi:MmgE/PrpD family protein [Microbacterium sp. P04]|uniref:MmgE/PrpD family protein n=1 Tax=Microbacterium sp. P04 TaxID=3366947 RepID=UPI0037460E7A